MVFELGSATVTWLESRYSPPIGKTFEMSKNECQFTLPGIEVNQNYPTLIGFKSAAYRPSTSLCFENGAAGYQSTAKMR
jgi:hypothetical protein